MDPVSTRLPSSFVVAVDGLHQVLAHAPVRCLLLHAFIHVHTETTCTCVHAGAERERIRLCVEATTPKTPYIVNR